MSKKNFQSDYIIGLESNLKGSKINSYIEGLVKDFLVKYDVNDYLLIKSEEQITHNEFKTVDFNYFYEKVVYDLSKENDLLDIKTKVCVTFDKRLCTIYDDHSDRYYNTLSIGGCSIVYYILFTLDEIYDHIYKDI
ncbi:hypothetical protein [Psychrobacter sp. 1Y4]|uniref:hypothetical protein n=1 Tax=Psychrobacter sp. 1Y4 TaxID=3453575 RepID=UPI003F46A970